MDTITKTKLHKTYGSQAVAVLMAHNLLGYLPREKGKVTSFEVKGELPNVETFAEWKKEHFTVKIGDLISTACSEYESLRDELQEWWDNLPEGFQNGSKGDELQEAIGYLENIQEPDIPDEIASSLIYWVPSEDVSSRNDRAGEALSMLNAAKDSLENRIQDIETAASEDEDAEENTSDLKELVDAIDEIISEAENFSAPGMY